MKHMKPTQQNYSRSSFDMPSIDFPDLSGIIGKLGGVAVLVVAVLLVYNFVLKPAGNKVSEAFGGNNDSSSYSETLPNGTDNSVILSNVEHRVEIYVEFEGKKSQMFLKKDYILCIGNNLQAELDIGYNNGFEGYLREGYHDFWVQSGDKKSDVYTVYVASDGVVTFSCKVGMFGPKFDHESSSGVTVEKK